MNKAKARLRAGDAFNHDDYNNDYLAERVRSLLQRDRSPTNLITEYRRLSCKQAKDL
jgi:hypothetical protein